MTAYDYLIGKSVTGVSADSDTYMYLEISDGSRVAVSCASEPDCCGYNSIDISIPEGFDFADNIITNVTDSSFEDGHDSSGTVKLGIFTNDSRISIEGDYGSGSGWNYGQYVCIEIEGGTAK